MRRHQIHSANQIECLVDDDIGASHVSDATVNHHRFSHYFYNVCRWRELTNEMRPKFIKEVETCLSMLKPQSASLDSPEKALATFTDFVLRQVKDEADFEYMCF